MFEAHHHTVLDFLREHALLDPEQLAAAQEAHETTGRAVADVAIDNGWVTQETLLAELAIHLGCPYERELPAQLSAEPAALVSANLARMYGVAALRADATGVDVLAVDPFNARVVEDLTFALGREVRVLVGDPPRVQALIDQHYGEDETTWEEVLADIEEIGEESDEAELSIRDLESIASKAPIVRFVNLVLAQAIREQASDIHF